VRVAEPERQRAAHSPAAGSCRRDRGSHGGSTNSAFPAYTQAGRPSLPRRISVLQQDA
jgi:hypothetical protein